MESPAYRRDDFATITSTNVEGRFRNNTGEDNYVNDAVADEQYDMAPCISQSGSRERFGHMYVNYALRPTSVTMVCALDVLAERCTNETRKLEHVLHATLDFQHT